jgi:hypothetical protein
MGCRRIWASLGGLRRILAIPSTEVNVLVMLEILMAVILGTNSPADSLCSRIRLEVLFRRCTRTSGAMA